MDVTNTPKQPRVRLGILLVDTSTVPELAIVVLMQVITTADSIVLVPRSCR